MSEREPTADLPATSAPKPPAERRARRAAVEDALLAGHSAARVLADLSARFGVSPRTVRSDMRRVERRWARDDAGRLDVRRAGVVRRLERLAVSAEAAGKHGPAVSANLAVARVLGMLADPWTEALAALGSRREEGHDPVRDRAWYQAMLADPEARAVVLNRWREAVGMPPLPSSGSPRNGAVAEPETM